MNDKVAENDVEECGGLESWLEKPVSRRRFLTTMAGGLAVGFFLPMWGRAGAGVAEAATLLPEDLVDGATAINAWVRIKPDGTIDLLFGGCEMGQGTMTGLAQILAEELKVGWNQIVVQRPDTSENVNSPVTPYPSTYLQKTSFRYLTGGSSGIARRWLPLRMAGAQARELLVAAAMWKLEHPDSQTDSSIRDYMRGNYLASNAKVTHVPTGRSWTYGALATTAASSDARSLAPNLDDPAQLLSDPASFKVVGQKVRRPDIPLKTNGSAKFGIDIWMPGMTFAVVKHCPTIGGVLKTTPARPAGAIAVVPLKAFDSRGAVQKDSFNAVAVVADNTWKARKISRSLSVSWVLPASKASVDSATIALVAKQRLATPGPVVWQAEPATTSDPLLVKAAQSAVASALATSTKTVEATFELPYVAHATMEVLSCTADVVFAGSAPVSCEIWAPTQSASGVLATASAITGLPQESIVVHTTFLGGGLGRKIEQDYIAQAVQTAMAVAGPIKLTWMREEDFANDNFRPMAMIKATAGLDVSKNIKAWSYRTVTPSISWQRATATNGNKTRLDGQAIEGAIHLPYARGTVATEWVPLDNDVAGLPVGYWRSVGSSLNTFAVESLVDMLAAAAGEDPFVFRMRRITDERTLAVLAAADTLSAWRKTLPAGRAWGMAVAKAFGTIVCEVFDISLLSTSSIRVHRVACAVDCGIAVNPDSVEAQMQGGIVHGINATLWGRSTFVAGVAQQTNFNRSRMMRLSECPTIQVSIVQNKFDPSGTGEPAVPPVAPAIANAHARLTGTRVTKLPFFPTATMGGL
jgi:isoquinoline 1-oxidoreductase beta subunit